MSLLKVLLVATVVLAAVSAQRSFCRFEGDCFPGWDCFDNRCVSREFERRDCRFDRDCFRGECAFGRCVWRGFPDGRHHHHHHRGPHHRDPFFGNSEDGKEQQQKACVPACGNRQLCTEGICKDL
uniref:Uncharacterized protein n=1 Tax=Plectus sambesii TaxID=2011161 RepID=A0A914UPM9_9BILA